MKRINILMGLSLLAMSMTLVGCGGSTTKQSSSEKSYKTLTVELSNSSVSQKYSAAIQGTQFVEIRPQISGTITKILIGEGANVKAGQTLFIIDQVPYQAALDVAKANVKSAQAAAATAELNAQSSQALFDSSVISNNELQIALNTLASSQADLALAQAQQTNAQNDLSYTVIKSPVDGVASMIPYRVGALVSSSITDPLVSVTNNQNMYAYFSMSESQILTLIQENGSSQQLLENMPSVELVLNNGASYQHLGKVDAISGTIDKSTGTVSLRATFQNPEQLLRDGGNGSVVIRTELDSIMIIPKVATFELQDKIFAYKVIDGKASSSELKIYPLDNGIEYIVESGLDVGDVIVAEGAGLLREGTVIIPQTDK